MFVFKLDFSTARCYNSEGARVRFSLRGNSQAKLFPESSHSQNKTTVAVAATCRKLEPAHRPDARTITRRGIRPYIYSLFRRCPDGLSGLRGRTVIAIAVVGVVDIAARGISICENWPSRASSETAAPSLRDALALSVLLIAFVFFTSTKLMLVVVPSMSTSTVPAVSFWSWLRFSPAIFTNDSPTTVELITVYLYICMVFPLG